MSMDKMVVMLTIAKLFIEYAIVEQKDNNKEAR